MINLVELVADEDEHEQSPCKFGNIVKGHACYCHHSAEDAPWKCPIWRFSGTWARGPWAEKKCPLFEPCDERESTP